MPTYLCIISTKSSICWSGSCTGICYTFCDRAASSTCSAWSSNSEYRCNCTLICASEGNTSDDTGSRNSSCSSRKSRTASHCPLCHCDNRSRCITSTPSICRYNCSSTSRICNCSRSCTPGSTKGNSFHFFLCNINSRNCNWLSGTR